MAFLPLPAPASPPFASQPALGSEIPCLVITAIDGSITNGSTALEDRREAMFARVFQFFEHQAEQVLVRAVERAYVRRPVLPIGRRVVETLGGIDRPDAGGHDHGCIELRYRVLEGRAERTVGFERDFFGQSSRACL